jgi:hypothetical protein
MTFSKYVCWQPEMVRKVMDVEATQPEDHIFLATHHPIKMYRQDLTEAQSRIPYDEESLLKDFLETPDFAFVPVLGTSGTGKSHLIRWLYTRLKSLRREPHYRVLLIPKVGTNLKDIIERILNGIEGSEFDEYRSRLSQAANTLTEAEACEQLLSNLAIAVGSSGRHDLANLSEAQIYLVESLPSLLFDPFFRQHWLRKDGIIRRLVIHTLGQHDSIEIIEERRGFTLEDLPLNILDIAKASAQARDFYGFLVANDEIQKETVNWLNTHLDTAISKVLNLGREDLQRLMLDVRRVLARQGVELILLIEDFAKLQGIDREILATIIERPRQLEGEPLCAMRTALACTTGYFKGSMADTVRTRTDFSVNLDIEAVNERSLMTETDVQQLASRYLNAVRLENKEIQAWLANSNEETGQPDDSVPNACVDCEYKPSCHAGFGQIDDIGLYPFNATAIERMRDRVNTGVFNPRTLIRDVLRYTLEYHRSDLEEGRFPSPKLLAHFKGTMLNVMIGREIKTKDSPDDAPRREALLNLWTNGNDFCDLPSEVHTAFNLRPLGIQVQKAADTITTTRVKAATTTFTASPLTVNSTLPVVEEQEIVSLPLTLAKQLEALDQWPNGAQLAQDVAQNLRQSIYPAIFERIDWDAELLLESAIKKLFLQRNINFDNASTSTTPKDIELLLPLKTKDLQDTAIALQAILLYEHHKNWGFSYQTTHGSTYFRIYAKKLEEWSNFVLQEAPKYTTQSRTTWNPVPAVVELLAIAGRMAGNPTNSLEDLVDVIFTDLDKNSVADRAESWQKLFNTLKKSQPELLTILEDRIPCTKGSSPKLQIIDASQLVEPLKAIAKDWKPQIDVSDVSEDKPFKEIRDARKAVDELLEQAIGDERDRHLGIYNQVINEFGEDFIGNKENKDRIVEALSQAIQKARDAGVSAGKLTELDTAIEEFKKTKIEAYIKALKEINEADKTGVLLQKLSQLSQKPVDAISNFINIAKQCLSVSTQRAESSLSSSRESGGEDLSLCYSQIETSLIILKNAASEIKGEFLC